MKNNYFYLLLFATFFMHGQYANRINFTYDAAGNQTQRTFCFCNIVPGGKQIADISAVKEEDYLNFFPNDALSYYPNPVKEELYLKWELVNDNQVTKIQVFTLNGQLLNTFSGLEESTTQSIPFLLYPSGVYLVLLNYKDGEQKSVKIIKE